jgi:hypothetical protein
MNTYSVSFQGVILSIWGNNVQIHLGAAHIATLYLEIRSTDLGITPSSRSAMSRNTSRLLKERRKNQYDYAQESEMASCATDW